MVNPNLIHLIDITAVQDFLQVDASIASENPLMKVAQKVQHDLDQQLVKVTLQITLSTSNELRASLLYDFVYKVENLPDFIVDKDEKTVFTAQFIGTLLGISYSTMRGIFYQKFKELNIPEILLPVLNPNDLLKMGMES